MPGGLKEFLASRRAAIDPADAGLPPAAPGRRRPGLRREELAALAGVSVDYIAKLEQGRVGNVSDQVLDAIADALRLDDLERRHLRSLVSVRPKPAAGVGRRVARPSMRALIDLIPTPAMIQGPRMEIVASNGPARVLLTDWSAMRRPDRNIARWLFLAPEARARYPDWESVAATTVAALRARHDPGVDDPALRQLVDDLSAASSEFGAFWADYRLFQHTHGRKRFFHEAVGELTLNYETLEIPDSEGEILCVYTPDPGSPAEEKLALLMSWQAAPVTPPARNLPGSSAVD